MLKEHEKFWAFVLLIFAVIGLAFMASMHTPEKDSAIRILDAAVGGLLLALGSASQALFRVSSVDKINAETAKTVAEKAPMAPQPVQPVTITQPADQPVPVQEAQPTPDDGIDPIFKRNG